VFTPFATNFFSPSPKALLALGSGGHGSRLEIWSRITRRLAEDDVIAVDGQRIAILDLAALRALANEVGSI